MWRVRRVWTCPKGLIAPRKPRCSTTWWREICQTSATGKVDLNLIQVRPFWI
jgi:hypothetical protein